MNKRTITGLAVFILWLLQMQYAMALTPKQAVKQISKISPNAGILVSQGDKILAEMNADKTFIPASCLKIPLVLAAYDLLGDDFRFSTSFYVDRNNNLLIKGEGDPFLTSEEISIIAEELKRLGHERFNGLHIDDSLFENVALPGLGSSNNPYDAAFSSLFVNFNTLYVKKSANKQIVSAEEQTPTLPLMAKLGTDLSCCNQSVRINLQGEAKYRRSYVQQLFKEVFSENGIDFMNGNSHVISKANHHWNIIYRHRNSQSLREISKQLMLYSNNLIANALLLQFSPQTKYPLQQSLQRWRDYLTNDLELPNTAYIRINEGAGLDRKNRFTPKQMLKILAKFDKYKDILPSDKAGAVYKTGTLTGIYNAAGYMSNSAGEQRSFVVFLEDDINHRNKIINILKMIE